MQTIKARKQGNSVTLTVPASFNIPAGTKMAPKLTPNGIFYEFVRDDNTLDFDTNILKDLIKQGYEGKQLLNKFQIMKKQIPQALDFLQKEAAKEPAMTKKDAVKEFGL